MPETLEPLELDVDGEAEPDFALTEEEEPAALSRVDPRDTLVRGEVEAFELRQRLRATAPVDDPSLDLQLEELTEGEDGPVEELSLEAEAEAEPSFITEPADEMLFAPEPEPAPEPRGGHVASPVWTRAPEPEPKPEPPPPPPPPPRVVAPPPPPPPPPPARVVAAPLTVEVRAMGGPTEVTIPLEVKVGDDQPPVRVELRLMLDVRVKP